MRLEVADGFTQLALHVLAHVPRRGPGDLFDARHVAESTRRLGARAQALLVEDTTLLAALWRADPALAVLDALPRLHSSLPAFRRTAARALAELHADDVADGTLLRALQRLGPAGELCHAILGLLADEFAEVLTDLAPTLARGRDQLRPILAALNEHVPGLADSRIELVWALGAHGRALPGRLLVGCPGYLVDAATPAIVAAHECSVWSSGQVEHVRAEWSALVRLAGWLRRAPAGLRDAHARWLASLDLADLLTSAGAAGLVTLEDADMLRHADADRAALLARLA